MYFPMASNQKESRRLIAATLAQAEEKRQESLMVDMHEGLANCRRNMEKECKRVGGEAEAARERGQRGVIDVAEAMDTKYGIAEYLRQEEEEALLPPWERKNSHIEIRPLQENDYNLNKKSRHSPRFTRIDKATPPSPPPTHRPLACIHSHTDPSSCCCAC